MSSEKRTRELLLEHYKKYSGLQAVDIFKYLYQSSFGCEHLVSNERSVVENISREYLSAEQRETLTEALDGEYVRVHLGWIDEGLSCETLGRLFCLSAKEEPNGKEVLQEKLRVAKELIKEGALPVAREDFERKEAEWRGRGYCAIRHSEVFRSEYKPSYRVISNEYVKFLHLFSQIDKRLKDGPTVLAIEGGSASGKTTLASMLKRIYGCTVFHMDDFFLRPEQRTAERYAEVGGNVDRERFLEEVLLPLSKGERVNYRRFDCSTQRLGEYIAVAPQKLTVIEGAYSMHPDLAPYYDLSIFLDITEECRRERILKRNSPQFAQMFFNKWIPLERVYFEEMNVKALCDFFIVNE